MALIAQTSGVLAGGVPVNVTRTTLTASDTLVYVFGGRQILSLVNGTGSPVVVTLTGSAPLSPTIPGLGTVSAAGGKAITVPANGVTLVDLDDISAYIAGAAAVAVTGGVGVLAHLYT